MGAADAVDDHVDRSLESFQPDQHLAGTGLGQPLTAGGRAHGRDHVRAGPRRQLDGEPADSAGGTGDQHPLARSDPGGPQRAQRRHSGDRQGDRLRRFQALRYPGERSHVDRDALRERPRRQGHHLGPHRRAGTVGCRPDHRSRGVRTEHRAHGDATGAGVVEVATVQRDVGDVHQDLARPGHGIGNPGEADSGGRGRIDDESTHGDLFFLWSRTC
ncbi:hypothetical protein [Streptomyces sp. NPDC093970]|uniref:hypothetical protein n=1 Tax=Streptomyces sp. NPDC093970 TaxID=3155076 RepID=UPI0034424C99